MNLVGPKKSPKDCPQGFGPNDTHLIVNDVTGLMKAYDSSGTLLWKIPCLAQGVAGPDWRNRNADTPPGLYTLGVVYRDYEKYGANAKYNRTLMSFGWYSFDLIGMEGQEGPNAYRDGCMVHGGGSAHGWPGAWNAKQPYLAYTHGCIRLHNVHLRDYILPLYEKGLVYVSVYQDAP